MTKLQCLQSKMNTVYFCQIFVCLYWQEIYPTQYVLQLARFNITLDCYIFLSALFTS